MRHAAATVVVTIALVALAGCGGADNGARSPEGAASHPPSPATFVVSGHIALKGFSTGKGEPCSGLGGYEDIAQGTQVTIYNGKSEAVALGSITGPGQADDDVDCNFSFEVADVPDDGTVYSVEVGHRGKVQFTKANAGALALSLGN